MNHLKIFYKDLTPYLFVTFIAICAHKILMALHLPNVESLISAAYGVTEGRPHWLAYQNRLLGPYSILSISTIAGISFKAAWAVYQAVTLHFFCILVFWILKREGLSPKDAITYLIFILFAFLSLQHDLFFPWDNIDLILFTLFAYGIIKSYSIRFFLAIFLIGILNRESALFIAAFLILDSVKFSKGKFSFKLAKPKSLLIGLGMLIAGIFYTKIVRHLLFVSNRDGLPDTKHELIGNHIYLFFNLKNFFFNNFTNQYFYISIFIISSFGYFLRNFRNMDDRQLKLLIISLVLFTNILIFGVITESRMLFILLPFFLFLWLSINQKISP